MTEEAEKQAEIDKTVEMLKQGSEEQQTPEQVLEQLTQKSAKPKAKQPSAPKHQSTDSGLKPSLLGLSMMACTLIGVFFIQSYVTPSYIKEKEPGVGLVMKEIVALKPRMDNMISSIEQVEAAMMADNVENVEPYLKVKMLAVETNLKKLQKDFAGLKKHLDVIGEDSSIHYGVISKSTEEIKSQINELGQLITDPEANLDPVDMDDQKGYRYKWKRDNKTDN